jgi:hypothetical protein
MSLSLRQYIFSIGPGSQLQLGTTEFPFVPPNTKTVLDGGVRGMQNSGLRLTSQSPSKVGAHTSIAFTGTISFGSGTHQARGQIFLSGRRLFIIVTAEDPDDGALPRLAYERFMSGLKPA